MNTSDAIELIRDAIPHRGGVWADLGAGDGLFTRPVVVAMRPSAYGGQLYAATASRPLASVHAASRV